MTVKFRAHDLDEIARCRVCGYEGQVCGEGGEVFVRCYQGECWQGPRRKNTPDAIAAWNSIMEREPGIAASSMWRYPPGGFPFYAPVEVTFTVPQALYDRAQAEIVRLRATIDYQSERLQRIREAARKVADA